MSCRDILVKLNVHLASKNQHVDFLKFCSSDSFCQSFSQTPVESLESRCFTVILLPNPLLSNKFTVGGWCLNRSIYGT